MNLNKPILDIITQRPIFESRQEIIEGGKVINKGYPLLYCDALANVLLNSKQDDLVVAQKMERWALANKILQNKEDIEFTSSEKELLIDLVTQFYFIAVMGPLVEILRELD